MRRKVRGLRVELAKTSHSYKNLHVGVCGSFIQNVPKFGSNQDVLSRCMDKSTVVHSDRGSLLSTEDK